MTTALITVNLAEFTSTGSAPLGAAVDVTRAQPGSDGTTLTTAASERYLLPAGHTQIPVDAGVPYWWQLENAPGLTGRFLAIATSDTTLAQLYSTGQIDPVTLAPLPSAPSIAAALAALQPVALTQAQYAALASPNPSTLYLITG